MAMELRKSDEEEQPFSLYSVQGEDEEAGVLPYKVCMTLNGETVTFEVDTGCGFTILNMETFKEKVKNAPPLKKTCLKLRTFTKQKIKVMGKTYVKVNYKQQENILPNIVVKGTGPNLLGRWWMKHIKLDWAEIKHLANHSQPLTLEYMLQKHKGVFKEELGTLKGFQATIHVPDNAAPRFYRPRSVPYAMKPKVDAEIDRLLKENIITVKYSGWAAPVVPLRKPDGNCRLCGDYKFTVNRVSTLEQYPIPKVED